MENYLKQNNIFCIIPNNFDNCSYIKFCGHTEKIMHFSSEENIGLNKDEDVELFSNGEKGVLYFCSKAESCHNNIIEVKFPEKYEIIQRRENERINIRHQISITDENGDEFNVSLNNISVGGIQIICNDELKLNNKYPVIFDFDGLNLNFIFVPTRQFYEDNQYVVSGQIKSKRPTDKIELVQYCYKKQFEQSNRN